MKKVSRSSVSTVVAALAILTSSSFCFLPNISHAAASISDPAPLFSGRDSHGKTRSLTDYSGKWVVLEWHNQDCPFVKRQYDSGHMQQLQKKWTKEGVIWLSIISSAKG